MTSTYGSASMAVLLEDDGHPVGGSWSFDQDNRQALPAKVAVPDRLHHEASRHVADVQALVVEQFSDHPGRAADFAWPTTRTQALAQLRYFIEHCLDGPGPIKML